MHEQITVIVPCYNVEEYLHKCLDSLLNQTFKKFKIILVDDYSTDNTRSIIKSYVKKSDKIKAIYNKTNQGQGHIRNATIKIVDTKYVTFLDSDDWIEPNFLEKLYNKIIENDSDIAICDIYIRYDNSAADFRAVSYHPKQNRFGFINVGFAASSNNKLFKTDILRTNRYPEGIMNEDVPVILTALYKSKLSYTGDTFYNYYQRQGSTQNSQISIKHFDIFKAIRILRENLGPRVEKKIWDSIIWHQIIQMFFSTLPRAKGLLYRRSLIKQFYGLLRKESISISSNNNFGEYIRSGLLNKVYSSTILVLLKLKLFTSISFIMGCFINYLRHRHRLTIFKKLIRAPYILVSNPKLFINKLRARIIHKYVIKKNISLSTLVAEARKQQKIRSQEPVSVVIPNYNYARFMFERLYSILYQSEKVGEILILDDNSTDNSVQLAKKVKKAINKYVPVRLINNTINQGTFKQWERGFKEAKYNYVWIAEADDYCSSKFLASTLKPMKENNDVVLSYVDTAFINTNGLFLESLKYHIDYQKSGHWDKDYINNGRDEILNYSYLNNIIANVSSVVFKKLKDVDYSKLAVNSRQYKQAGDWVFYTNYMLHGDVAYTDKTINYYRVHGNNVTSNTKAADHLKEIYRIYDMIDGELGLTKTHKMKQRKRIDFLKKAWKV